MIYGASGTGKGAIAKWIHTSGPRAACVFREATRDTSLIDNIPLAQGGTLVIHEIGEWPLSEQLNLLTFLKTKSLPISNGIRMLVNVRIIATTSQSLEGRAQTGLFNSELLQKLNVFRIEMPPLSKRVDEFEDIVLGIVAEITRDLHKAHLRDLTPKAWSRVRSYEWPGNLRELRNVLRLTVAAAQGDLIEVTDLPDLGNDRIDFRTTREQFEKTYILELLRTFNWEVDTTCKMAKMNRETLVQKISQYGITQHP
ncbi:MAG TPA: hypothetical protein DCS07_02095 [Bdellovibrionales bacterium]|nr:hypothetical protein [Bdellovibrionales bacterium]